MSRTTRTVMVIAVATVMATVATLAVYAAVSRIPVREVEVASLKVVVAVEKLPTGTRLAEKDLKLVAWPVSSPLPGAFQKIEDVVNRGLVAGLVENEPITESKLAPLEAGAGLPPSIPPGMRAMSVKVDEVVGVAGFVVPGTRVDLVVTVRGGGANKNEKPMSRTVLSNVLVLTAGTRYDQEQGLKGEPQPATVVTLAVMPEDAERIALAASEGKISLALRNPLDVTPTETNGVQLDALMTGRAGAPLAPAAPVRRAAARPAAAPAAPPVAAPSVKVYVVETIRAAKRVEETVR
jgi:pilus assembly protein CpaB